MLTAIIVFWFLMILAAITYVGYRYWARPAAYMERVGVQTVDGVLDLGEETEQAAREGVTRVIRKVGEAVPVDPATAHTKRKLLMAAGYYSESAVAVMYGLQIASALLVALLAAAVLTATRQFTFPSVLGTAILLGLAGYAVPNEILRMLIHRRRKILRHSLPDALDLLVICVESGLGLDQGLQEVSQELRLTYPELSQELALVNLELRAGKRRSDALRSLATRTGEPEIKKLVAILIQTDRFGTSIAQALRTHADFMRVRRRQVAEEKANKVGVKLVFPIFFFILPSMFLVTVGPALLHLFFEFFPRMQQGL
jgi:tight adherence protein C